MPTKDRRSKERKYGGINKINKGSNILTYIDVRWVAMNKHIDQMDIISMWVMLLTLMIVILLGILMMNS